MNYILKRIALMVPTLLGALPGMSAMASAMMRKEIAALDFPPVGEFLELIHDAGAKIYACKMSVDMMKLTQEDFVPYAQILGAMEFLEIAEDAQILFV
mgnify:CR=1 FL=1